MTDRRPTNDAPFNIDESRFLFTPDGWKFFILRRTRRNVVIAFGPHQVRLCRRNLERDGVDTVGSLQFRVTNYELPDEAAEGEVHDPAC